MEEKEKIIEQIFDDNFEEFLKILKDVDLSSETLENLNDLFEKDKKLFFRYTKIKLNEIKEE